MGMTSYYRSSLPIVSSKVHAQRMLKARWGYLMISWGEPSVCSPPVFGGLRGYQHWHPSRRRLDAVAAANGPELDSDKGPFI